MIAELTLPRLGETMETGRVAAWLKQPGDAFRRGETLVEIESDKTVVEMPALADGVLREIVVPAGADAEVGAVLCRYEDGRGEGQGSALDRVPVAPARGGPTPGPSREGVLRTTAQDPRSEAQRATPLARSIARQNKVALDGLDGSGRRGRIEADDVRAALSTQAPTETPSGHVQQRQWAAQKPTGPRVVLLHGLAADIQSWAALAAALARSGRSVTALDLPGHGGTEVAATTVDDAAAAMVSVLEPLGAEPFDLVGHSLGGAVAARTARRIPGSIRRLTLIAPVGLDRAIDVEFVRGIARARASGALAHLLRRLTVRPASLTAPQLEALTAELARGRLHSLADGLVDDGGQQVDITADLRALAMPVRVVWGLMDRIIPWTQAAHAGSRCAIHLIPDAGHVPHWDQPAEVAALFD